jgi:hypothetical protein
MTNRFGFTTAEWDQGKSEMTQILQAVAADRAMIPYGELSNRTKSIRIDAHSEAMGYMLGEISAEEDARGRGMLSVIVVHRIGDMEPGHGFYELAGKLGRNSSDKVKLWVSELHKVHDHWANAMIRERKAPKENPKAWKS